MFLTGNFRFHSFPTAGGQNWKGLIIQGVRIEVDETKLFDANNGTPFGSTVRTDTRLIVRGKAEDSYGSPKAITLHDELPSAGELRAGFTKWQVVIGSGFEKRVLIEIDLGLTTIP